MSRASNAVDNFLEGFACSQAVFAEYCQLFDLDREHALKMSSGFAGGMRMGATCGAVTSAYLVLGLKFGRSPCEKPEGRRPVYGAVSDFTRRFEADNGSLNCKALLGCDISTAKGLETAKEKDLFRTVCPRFVRSSVELLDEILESEPAPGAPADEEKERYQK